MALDLNDEETRRRHMQIIAIHLANLSDDLASVNAERAEWHMATNMLNGPPSEEALKEASADFYVVWELIGAYRKFYS